jgi:hypothetical protein
MTEREARAVSTGNDEGDHPIDWEISRRFLRYSIGVIIGSCLGYLALLAAFTQGQAARGYLALGYMGVAAVAWLLLARGRARGSVWVLGLGSWLVMTLSCAFLGGVAGTAVISSSFWPAG